MEYLEGTKYFTKNQMFVYQNYYQMVKVANSGYTYEFIDFLECGNTFHNLSAFDVALKRVKEFRRVLVEGYTDDDFTVMLNNYRYGDRNISIYMTLRPNILDQNLCSITLTNELDHDYMVGEAISHTNYELIQQWESLREKIITQEYIDDLDELIEALTYATLNGDFECNAET